MTLFNKKSFILLAFSLLLVGCGTAPKLDKDLDEIQKSPCACEQLEFDDIGYRWIG